MVGGSGERKTLRLVARYADACNLFPGPEVGHKLEVLRRYCDEEGRDYAAIEKTSLYLFDASGGSAAVDEAVATLRGLASVGIQTIYFGVRDVFTLRPLEVVAREIMPAVADCD
jgi:alkanesulfonate monooxygenase SsuD/methylene tetrahydromethanopterin reductase-like flavin-dependent oxidoreductase (luciferase family)